MQVNVGCMLLLLGVLLLQLLASANAVCTELTCVNGKCDSEGMCRCNPCFSGHTCNDAAKARPQLHDMEVTATKSSAELGDALATLAAVDPDTATCSGGSRCDCGSVQYSLLSGSDKFRIDSATGKVFARSNLAPIGAHRLRVRAANLGNFSSDATEAELLLTIVEQTELRRQRRATVNAPTEVAFQYRQTYPVENITHLKMGEKLAFEVTVSFPAGTTSMNLEMFSPDNETVAMIMICDAQIVSVGKNLNVDRASVLSNALYEGKNGTKWPYTRIGLNLGDVTTNSSTGDAIEDFQVVVAYEGVFLYNNFVIADTEYWVSVGAEYNNESIIWIGQTSFKADMDPSNLTDSTESPTMNITGDASVYPGRISLYNLDITVPYLYSNFTVDVFGPLNNSELLTMCGQFVKDAGVGFGCVPTNQWPYAFELSKQLSTHTNYYRSMLSFTATKFTNKAWRMPNSTTENHRLTLQFALSTNASAAVGTDSYIGATVDFGPQVVTAYKVVTVSGSEQPSTASNTTTTDPVINMTLLGPETLAPNAGTLFELTMDTVPNSVFDYEIQALMPSNNSLARMKVCSLNITYAGRNIPCVGLMKERLNTTFRILYNDTGVASDSFDYAFITLRNLLNTGAASIDEDPLANRITVQMVAVANNHTLNVPGESAYVTMGVMYADRQWVSIRKINFTDSMNLSSLPNASLPHLEMSYIVGDETFGVGETAVVEVNTTLRRGVTYAPLDFELIMPFQNGSAVMTVCSYKVVFVGKNIGCSDGGSLDRIISLTSKVNSTVYDKAVFSLGMTSNVGPTGVSETEDDIIRLRFNVKMLEHPSSSNGSAYSVSYGFQFSHDQIWIAQLNAMFVSPAPVLPALTGDKIPHATFTATTSTVKAGATMQSELLVKIGPGSYGKYQLHVAVPSFASLCTVTVAQFGRNVSCVNNSAIPASIQRAAFTTADKEKLTANATFDLGYMHNAAEGVMLSRDTIFDDNSLLLKVIVLVDSNAVVGSGDLKAELYHEGTAAPVTVTQSVSVEAGTASIISTNSTPTFNLGLAPLFDGLNESTVYAPGQAFKAVLNVTTVKEFNANVRVQFVSPVNEENQIDILNVSVVSVGLNIPCLRPWAVQEVITKRNNSLSSDYGTLDLGGVCNYALSDIDADNLIQIEAIGRIWTSEAAILPGSLPVSCLVFLNDQQIFVQSVNLTVDRNVEAPKYFTNTSTIGASFVDNTPIVATIGSNIDIAMTVQVPEFSSSQFKVDFRNVDLNFSAWATVNEVNITSSGMNLAGLSNEPYSLDRNSTYGTAQRDTGWLKVYTIQNSGLTTVANMNNPPADSNNFTINFNVKIADHVMATNGSVFQLSLGMHLLDRIIIGLRDITILRTGNEVPDSEVFVNVTTDPTVQASAGVPVVLIANITCSNASTAELQNPILFMHTPPYIEFLQILNSSFESGSVCASPIPNAGFKLELNNTIFFGESVVIYFTVALKSGVMLPGGKQLANATTVYEMTYKMHDRAGNANNGKYFRKLGSVGFMVRSVVEPPSACSGDLGMNNSATIPDCAITSFLDPFPGFEAAQARPTGSGWKPHIRGNDYQNLRWVTVLFGNLKQVARVIVYATGSNRPTCINVYKTKDGRAFSLHDEAVNIGSLYTGHIANISLSSTIVARGIRIGICGSSEGADAELVVKFGLEGCAYTGTDLYPFSACSRQPYNLNKCGRHYLTSSDNSTIFYCDYVLTNTKELSGMSKCYKASTATPRTWQYLGPAVGKVLAYQESENRIFGLAQGCAGSGDTDRSYVVSDDGGSTWAATNPEHFIGVRDSPTSGTVSLSRDINWVTAAGFMPGANITDCTLHYAGDWKLCYDGIWHTTNQVVSWNSCCLR